MSSNNIVAINIPITLLFQQINQFECNKCKDLYDKINECKSCLNEKRKRWNNSIDILKKLDSSDFIYKDIITSDMYDNFDLYEDLLMINELTDNGIKKTVSFDEGTLNWICDFGFPIELIGKLVSLGIVKISNGTKLCPGAHIFMVGTKLHTFTVNEFKYLIDQGLLPCSMFYMNFLNNTKYSETDKIVLIEYAKKKDLFVSKDVCEQIKSKFGIELNILKEYDFDEYFKLPVEQRYFSM